MPKLSDATLRRMTDYVNASAYITTGVNDYRIPAIVVEQWSRHGHALLSTNELARRFGSTRRTICFALDRLKAANFIREIGRTEDGRAMYEPCLERGEEWRARFEERARAA